MLLQEYTAVGKENLNRMDLAHMEYSFGMRLLWCDYLTEAEKKRLLLEHRHTFFEVFFVVDGEVTYSCNREVIGLGAGEGLLISPEVAHYVIAGDEKFVRMSLAFTAEKQSELAMLLSEAPFQSFHLNYKMLEILDRILFHSKRNTLFATELVGGSLLELLQLLCEELGMILPERRQDTEDVRYFVATQFINNNKHRVLYSEEVAKECSLSVKQLNRIFRIACGKTVHEFITQERLRYAKNQLISTKLSVKEIAFFMGFENECSFTKFFKRHCGISPVMYRSKNSELLKEDVRIMQ